MKYQLPSPDETTYCLECGREIIYGRLDKKFCSCDCKNMYHNRNRRAKEIAFGKVQAILQKNYAILSWLLWAGRTNACIEELSEMGFDQLYYTEHRKIGIRKEYACFDIAYYLSDSKIFNVRRLDFNKNVNGYICSKTRKQ